jgi:hypothetical protein
MALSRLHRFIRLLVAIPCFAATLPPRCNDAAPSFFSDARICEIFTFHTTESLRACLANKRILVLGDSTMTETVHGMVMILSGAWYNRTVAQNYMRRATRAHTNGFPIKLQIPEFGETNMTFLVGGQGHRKFAVDVQRPRIHIDHRFTGHHTVGGNMGGIATFTHPRFQAELGCLLGETPSEACPKPDVIIVDSGIHDN